MLSLRDVQAGYGAKSVLHGVTVEVGAGSIVTLLGANGAGKSTTLKTIIGLLRPSSGAICLDGAPLPYGRPDRMLGLGVAMVAEQRELFPSMSVADNLRLGGFLRRGTREVGADLEKVLDLFPRLRARLAQPARTLSGGEQQMLAIGRALMARPRLLLLDEPSLGLAPRLVTEMFETIRRLNAEGTTILLVEQNVRQALAVAHYAYVLETGAIRVEGPSESLRESPLIQASYL